MIRLWNKDFNFLSTNKYPSLLIFNLLFFWVLLLAFSVRWSCIKLKSDVKKSIRNVEESVDGSTNCHSMKSLDCAKQVQSKTNGNK